MHDSDEVTQFNFYLGTFIEEVRELMDPAKVYALWERTAQLYDQNRISKHMCDEAYSEIEAQLKRIKEVRRTLSNV